MLCSRKARDGSDRREALADHVRLVADLCERSCRKFGVPSLGRLVGLVHDAGKSSEQWQRYLLSDEQSEMIPHAPTGAKLLCRIAQEFPDESYERYVAEIAELVVWGHHSGLPDMVEPDGAASYEERLQEPPDAAQAEAIARFQQGVVPQDDIRKLLKSAAEELRTIMKVFTERCNADVYPEDVRQENRSSGEKRKILQRRAEKREFFRGLLTRMAFSCLCDGDRYASACWENRLEAATYTTDPKLWAELAAKLEKRLDGFPDAPINTARRQISDECLESAKKLREPSGIYRLNVVTGGGKTLAVMRSALYLARKFGKDHVFYVAPFTTIIDQTAQNLRETFGRGDILLEHHSNLVGPGTDENEKRLREKEDQLDKFAERWDIPIILTSQVQFLEALFSGRGQCVRRMHQLCDSVLIFDEVQSVPVKCISMFNLAIDFLAGFCGCTVILCSATQPALEEIARPLRFSEPADLVRDVRKRFPVFDRVQIVDKTQEEPYTAETLSEFVLQLSREIRSVLIVLNTKKAVKEAYAQLKAKGRAGVAFFHLSTNMCGAHRLAKIAEMNSLLAQHKAVICVSTNLIEAGVDISFDAVIRSKTGLDSLTQASGRCNRNKFVERGYVYLIRYEETGLAMLPDLRRAQDAMTRVLSDMPFFPVQDYFSEETLRAYYRYYYHGQRGSMDYPAPHDAGRTLFDYLAANRTARVEYESRHERAHRGILHQAFRTAGREFRVIDENTTGILVPYGKGIELQRQLLSASDYLDKKTLFRELQRYSVSVYPDGLRKLEKDHKLLFFEDLGIYCLLDEESYDDEYGIVFEGGVDPAKYIC